MSNLLVLIFFVFVVAAGMSMVGKGGGNFYVLILVMSGIPMYEAAATAQFILLITSLAALSVFHKNRTLSWPLATLIGSFVVLPALCGGYFSHLFSGFTLKLIFAAMLFISGTIMLIPVVERKSYAGSRIFGFMAMTYGDEVHSVNLWIVLPITITTGFVSGMVGVSGGSFLVPLMLFTCGVSMRIAIGTATILIAATAFMGLVGHIGQSDFNTTYALPLAFAALIGGFLGGKLTLNSKPKNLKKIFAYTNWLSAFLMLLNAYHTKGIM